jgi:FAD/FMN-containing dehydrogenase
MASATCRARLHFGKANLASAPGGDWQPTDVAYMKAQLGDGWTRFEAIARQLDPTGKFADVNNLMLAG